MVGNNITNRMSSMRDRRFFRSLIGGVRILISDKLTMIYLGFISFVLLLAVIGPLIVPYGYNERIYGPDGEILFSAAPTLAHPLGTTDSGYDVLSRIVYGARPTVVTGMVSGFMIFSIGMTIGVVSGYVGGRVGNILMRFTDLTYSIPLIPFALVVVAIFGSGFYVSIVIIGAVLWRGLARVIRSQVLQIKERPFILAAKRLARAPVYNFQTRPSERCAHGNSISCPGYRIRDRHPSWTCFSWCNGPVRPVVGIMVRNAYESGMMSSALWWSLPPGF
ncbi:ABC transporter permease [Natrialba swarupiae]|nr:ABC transporter permease [Natrialba swarupiae]